MQDKGWNYGGSFELGAGQPLLSMRLLCAVVFRVGFIPIDAKILTVIDYQILRVGSTEFEWNRVQRNIGRDSSIEMANSSSNQDPDRSWGK